jgi:hypothetical protein
MFDRTDLPSSDQPPERPFTRRHALRTIAEWMTFSSAAEIFSSGARAAGEPCRGDVAIDDSTAQVFCEQAPLSPGPGCRDARAVWCHVPPGPDHSVLIYLHGFNGYVTVDEKGRSRVPDWAAGDAAARAGAAGKLAAPLGSGLDRLDAGKTGKKPVVIVPEVCTLASGSFWAKEPTGQYTDRARLGGMIADCGKHLARLQRPGGGHYLANNFLNDASPTGGGKHARTGLERIYLCGHSGAGLPIEEAANATLISPEASPTDLWLFDCTYWSRVDGFVKFCERWHRASRLAAGRRDASRFVCIYRPQTQTEEVADDLRSEIATLRGVKPEALVIDHSPTNLDSEVRSAFKRTGVVFVRSYVPHDEIPTVFIPVLLETAAS